MKNNKKFGILVAMLFAAVCFGTSEARADHRHSQATFGLSLPNLGIYVGNGMVIEAQGRDAGVVMRHLSCGGWTHQGRHPALAEDTAPTVFRLTSPMMHGENVRLMQAALTACGYDCGKADGICGKATMTAVKAFATAHTEV